MLFSLIYILLIIAANILASLWIIPLPFGLAVPAGVICFAPIFTLRDRIQIDRGAKWIYSLILIAALLSWLTGLASGSSLLSKISIAGLIAFVLSESLDTIIFTLIRRSFVIRALASNLVSAGLDSALFIWIAFGWNTGTVIGLWLVKIIIAALVIPILKPKSEKIKIPVV
ncbi:MAG: VUT family protein [Candidatus Electryonea clarkiae]|nr:VUT family protein [Candidatus Electryonea clarkiae]MDP8288383.1 VUT family protein [Candidatus Electryonea clarkiae]